MPGIKQRLENMVYSTKILIRQFSAVNNYYMMQAGGSSGVTLTRYYICAAYRGLLIKSMVPICYKDNDSSTYFDLDR